MRSAKQTRSNLILVLIVIVVTVVVFGRKSAIPKLDAGIEAPLVLRRGLAMSIPEREPRQSADRPIPDVGEPIDWEAVDAVRKTESEGPDLRSVPVSRGWKSESSPRQGSRPTRPSAAIDSARAATPGVSGSNSGSTDSRATPTRFHRIVEGETLRDLSSKYLGSPDRYLELFYANRAVLPQPDVLPLGARIVIPDQTTLRTRSESHPWEQPAASPWSSTPAKGIRLPDVSP